MFSIECVSELPRDTWPLDYIISVRQAKNSVFCSNLLSKEKDRDSK